MEIKNSYLIWIGSEHYPGITDWHEEAVTHGISKRLPGASIGAKLMEPGTVIFVAHDEGEFTDCEHCLRLIDCPECRKATQEVERLQAEIEKFVKRYDDMDDFNTNASGSHKRSVAIRSDKVEKLLEDANSCNLCGGTGKLEAGSGGVVNLNDGTTMDYRTYNYWLHQPGKFDPETVVDRDMCVHCGGTGKLPCSKIFGMFVPDDIEYILTGDESEAVLAKVKRFTRLDAKAVKAEAKRGCGYRKAGGTYVVTSADSDPAKAKEALAKLVKAGLITPEATEIHGSFVRFVEPIEVEVKRFRGIKSWSLDPVAEEAADDVMEAMV